MTLGVIEPKTSEIICPALEVTSGQKTFEAANKEYGGLTLPCIHCWEELRRNGTRWLDRGLVAAIEEEMSQQMPSEYEMTESNKETWSDYREDDANLIRSLVAKGFESALGATLPLEYDVATEKVVRTAVDATFRKGFFNRSTGRRRWMHFIHNTGRLKGTSQISCHDPSGINHQVAVGSFKLKLENDFKAQPGLKVILEKTIICKPGEPPETRRPDLVVYKDNEVIQVLEIQRSFIGLKSIQERTNNLRNICGDVKWCFSRGIYNRTSMYEQRRWLTEIGVNYFYYWYDEKTGKLEYTDGRPPEIKKGYSEKPYIDIGSVDAQCRHFDSLDDMGDDWRKNPENLTLKNLGAAVYSTNDQGKSFCSDEGESLTVEPTSEPISKAFHPEYPTALSDEIFHSQEEIAFDDRRHEEYGIEVSNLDVGKSNLNKEHWFPSTGDYVHLYCDGDWHGGKVVTMPNDHPDPKQKVSFWKVSLDSGEIRYVWNSTKMKLAQG